MITLFDQETAERNYRRSVVREARADERLTTIKNFMEATQWSATEAMNAMKIPADQQAIYIKKLR